MRPPLLTVKNLNAYYGELQSLRTIDFSLAEGEVLSVVGANGAGKTTLLKSICGLMNHGVSARMSGQIFLSDIDISAFKPADIVRAGIALVPEGRRLFSQMTVEENLLCGAYVVKTNREIRAKLAEIFTLFPKLANRRGQIVSRMSGGEQQMVAVGRALMSSPRIVLFDELSLGLAPVVVDALYQQISTISYAGVSCVIVEQSLSKALSASKHTLVLREGSIKLSGSSAKLHMSDIEAAYFGTRETKSV